jgi:hypothetical protein
MQSGHSVGKAGKGLALFYTAPAAMRGPEALLLVLVPIIGDWKRVSHATVLSVSGNMASLGICRGFTVLR